QPMPSGHLRDEQTAERCHRGAATEQSRLHFQQPSELNSHHERLFLLRRCVDSAYRSNIRKGNKCQWGQARHQCLTIELKPSEPALLREECWLDHRELVD